MAYNRYLESIIAKCPNLKMYFGCLYSAFMLIISDKEIRFLVAFVCLPVCLCSIAQNVMNGLR